MIKSISKISSAGQLPEGYLMEESTEAGDIKRRKGYISVEELETYLGEYLVKNLPRFLAACQAQDFGKTNREREESVTVAAVEIGVDSHHQNIMRSDEYSMRNEYVLGSNIRRSKVVCISFDDKFPENLSVFGKYWDVSEAGNESVMAYAAKCGEYYEITICGVGGVMAPARCNGLFAYYSNLRSVYFNSGFDTSQVVDMSNMFYGCMDLKELDVSGFNTSHVTDMNSMFCWCGNLTKLDVSGFDTSQVKHMGYMFNGCKSLTKLDVSGFDTSHVIHMGWMFGTCRNLMKLDVSGFDTSQVIDMSCMFDGCVSLKKLDVSGFNTSRVISMLDMFSGCKNLTGLDTGGFDTSRLRIP